MAKVTKAQLAAEQEKVKAAALEAKVLEISSLSESELAALPEADKAALVDKANQELNVEPAAELPTHIKLVTPFGFYDEENNLLMWQSGQEVTDADEIAALVAGGAEFEVLS